MTLVNNKKTVKQFAMYGDSIFPNRPYLSSRINASSLCANREQYRRQDIAMSSCRIAVEWEYGEVDQLFKFSENKNNLKLLNGGVEDIYFAHVLLRNCYVCLYENKISQVFNCPPPSLEKYFSW